MKMVAVILGLAAVGLAGCSGATGSSSLTSWPATTRASVGTSSASSDPTQPGPTELNGLPSSHAPNERPALQRGPARPDRATIIDGSWLIGADHPPALYLVPTAVTRCHWRVLDYATGNLIEEGRYRGPGPAAIWVGDGDLLQSEGCLLWQGYPQLTGSRTASMLPLPEQTPTLADGTWQIGATAPAGRYRSDRSALGPCAYQVDRAGERDDESYESSGTVRSIPAYLDLTLVAGDVFTTRECGPWRLIDEAP